MRTSSIPLRAICEHPHFWSSFFQYIWSRIPKFDVSLFWLNGHYWIHTYLPVSFHFFWYHHIFSRRVMHDWSKWIATIMNAHNQIWIFSLSFASFVSNSLSQWLYERTDFGVLQFWFSSFWFAVLVVYRYDTFIHVVYFEREINNFWRNWQ